MRISFILLLLLCMIPFMNDFMDDKAEAMRIIQIIMLVGVVVALLIEVKLRKEREAPEGYLIEVEPKLQSIRQTSTSSSEAIQ